MSLPFDYGQPWMNHGLLSKVLGNWQTNYTFLARSGQAFNPSWGRRKQRLCTTSVTVNCVPATIAGVALTGTDPANLLECRRRHYRL